MARCLGGGLTIIAGRRGRLLLQLSREPKPLPHSLLLLHRRRVLERKELSSSCFLVFSAVLKFISPMVFARVSSIYQSYFTYISHWTEVLAFRQARQVFPSLTSTLQEEGGGGGGGPLNRCSLVSPSLANLVEGKEASGHPPFSHAARRQKKRKIDPFSFAYKLPQFSNQLSSRKRFVSRIQTYLLGYSPVSEHYKKSSPIIGDSAKEVRSQNWHYKTR